MNEPTTEQWQQIEAELFAGRKIQAIKLFRAATGCDLTTAKTTLDEHETALRQSDPDKFQAPSSGCGSAALLLTGAGLTLLTAFS